MANLNSLAETVLTLLITLNSSAATPSQIASANKALDDVKKSLNPADALKFSELLLSQTFLTAQAPSVAVVHYAFHIIDAHLLQSAQPWTEFPDHVRASVRTLATTLVSRLLPTSPSLLTQKTISLLVALALREWPQRWPDFLDQLLVDSTPPRIACLVLQELSDEIHVFSDRIQSARRQDLRHAMALSLPQILAYVTNALQRAHDASDLGGVTAALDCLHSIVLWADLRTLFTASVPNACLRLLSTSTTRDAALDVLDAFVRRQFSNARPAEDDSSVTAVQPHVLFREVMFPGVLGFLSESPFILRFAPFSLISPCGAFPALVSAFNRLPDLSSLDQENYDFCLRFFDVIATLGATHFFQTFCFDKRTGRVPLSTADATCAAAFVDTLTIAVASPSVSLCHCVLPFFTSIFSSLSKHPDGVSLRDDEFITFLVNAFLQASSVALIKFPDDGISRAFSELDDSDEVRILSMSVLSPRISAAISLAARLNPPCAALTAKQRLLRIFEVKPTSVVEVVEDGTGKGSIKTSPMTARHRRLIVSEAAHHSWNFSNFTPEVVREWRASVEGVCNFVDAISLSIMASGDDSALNEILITMKQVFEVVHQTSDAVIAPVKPQIQRVFYPLYVHDERYLTACVESLLAAVSGSTKNNEKKLRGTALNALSSLLRKLGNANIQTIARFYQPLCACATEALGNRELRSMDKIHLMEAALACVMALSGLNEQSEGAERVFHPILSYFSTEQMIEVLQSPQNLLTFLKKRGICEVEDFCELFLVLEAGMHQLVRPVSKANGPIPLPNMLSRSIAPKAAQLSCILISSLHGMFNESIRLNEKDELTSILQPTCREIVFVLNLDTTENFPKGLSELAEHRVKVSKGEARSAEVLRANGVTPPDEKHGRIREQLRDLRRSGYEIMRAAILSGGTQSESHLRAIVKTTCEGTELVEPLHLLSILGRIVGPLLSFSVCGAGADYLMWAGECGLNRILAVVREHILNAQRETDVFSATQLTDLTRDHGRRMLARAAADMIVTMYPRVDIIDERLAMGSKSGFVPAPLRCDSIKSSLLALWCTLCDAKCGAVDDSATRVALPVAGNAADFASSKDFSTYASLLPAVLRTAVVYRKSGDENGLSHGAVTALVGMMRRWPDECEAVLKTSLCRGREDVTEWIDECMEIFKGKNQETHGKSGSGGGTGTSVASRSKRSRTMVRTLVDRIGELEGIVGVGNYEIAVVHALPEKLNTVVSARKRTQAKRRAHLEDVELTDGALDSLFGEGDPL